MAKLKQNYVIMKRSGVRGDSFTARVWSPKAKKYAHVKTFAERNYGSAKAAKAAAESWGSDTARQVWAGVVGDEVAGAAQTSKVVDQYLEYLEEQRAGSTYMNDVRSRLSNLHLYTDNIDAKDSERQLHRWWQDWCNTSYHPGHKKNAPRNKSNSTKNSGLRNLKSLVRWAWKYRMITGLQRQIDLDWIDPIPIDHQIKPQFTLDELRQGLSAVHYGFCMRWALYIYLGLRSKEALQLRYDDFVGSEVHIRVAKKNAVGRRPRIVAMQCELWMYLKYHRSQGHDYDGFLFPSEIRKTNSNGQAFHRFLKQIGIESNGRTIHSLRHCYAGLMTATGEQPGMLQLFMGHTKQDMTTHYAQMAARFKKDVERWPRGQLKILGSAV